jgi:hypothetical protein
LAAATLLLLALPARPSRAAEPAEEQTRALFADGNDRVEAGDYLGALERFRAAYARWPNAKILLNIGTMCRQIGREAEAADTYEAYLRDAGADPAKTAEIQRLVREIDARLGKLRITPSDPAMSVRVDGVLAGPPGAPLTLRIPPGSHAVLGEIGGAVVAVVTLKVAAGEVLSVSLARPPPASTPVGPARSATAAARAGAARAASPAGQRAVDAPSGGPTATHAGQVGLTARGDIDGSGHGVAAAIGFSYGLGDHFELAAAGLLSRDKGVEPSVTAYILRGALKPIVSLGAPVFFVDGPHPGVRGSAGLQWDPSRHFGLFAALGAAVFPSVPTGYEQSVLLPAVGVQGRIY